MSPLLNWSDKLQDITILTHPDALPVIASQLQKQVKHVRVQNLTQCLADLTLEWSVQGASFITLSVIDPAWQLLTSRFIDVDDAGLVVPLEIHYPPDSDCYWWLVKVDATKDLTQANLHLTFEDRICSQLRDVFGPMQSNPGETRASFINRIVSKVQDKQVRFWAPSVREEQAAAKYLGLPANTISAGTQVPSGTANPLTSPPASSTAPGASPQRKNPTKQRGIAKGTPGVVSQNPGADIGGTVLSAVSGVIDLLNPPDTAPAHGGTF